MFRRERRPSLEGFSETEAADDEGEREFVVVVGTMRPLLMAGMDEDEALAFGGPEPASEGMDKS